MTNENNTKTDVGSVRKRIIVTGAVAALAVAIGGTAYKIKHPTEPAATSEASAPATAPAAETPAAPAAEAPAAEAPAAPAATQEATQPAAPAATQETQQAAATPPVVPATPPAMAPVVAEGTPSFDAVRVEPTGEAVISGRASPGAEVLALLNGAEVGKATANADGAFVIIPATALPKGAGVLTLSTMKDGKVLASAGSIVVAVKEGTPALVAKVDPVAPTEVTQVAAATADAASTGLQLSAVDYDEQGNIVFTGKAAADQVVRFYVDNQLANEVKADANGNWSFRGNNVAEGTHTLRADALNAEGAVATRIELPFQREAAAKVAEATPPATPEVPQAAAPAAAPAAAEPEKIVIQPGNSLWKISRKLYGKGRLFTVIYEANKDQLRDPNRIYPGQILSAPKAQN